MDVAIQICLTLKAPFGMVVIDRAIGASDADDPANDRIRREPLTSDRIGLGGPGLQHAVSASEELSGKLAVSRLEGPLNLPIDSTGIKAEGGSHTSILLAPAVKRLFRYLRLPDCINARHSLAAQHLNLPQLRNNLFRFVSLHSNL